MKRLAVGGAMSITDIKNANAAAGQHWFEPATMRFFRSKVEATVYEGPGGVFFVSSEQYVSSAGIAEARRWTVRRFCPESGEIGTVGPFNERSQEEAHKEAKRLSLIDTASSSVN